MTVESDSSYQRTDDLCQTHATAEARQTGTFHADTGLIRVSGPMSRRESVQNPYGCDVDLSQVSRGHRAPRDHGRLLPDLVPGLRAALARGGVGPPQWGRPGPQNALAYFRGELAYAT